MSTRHPHATKRGPGRRHKDGTYRGGKPKVSYGRGIQAQFERNRTAKANKRNYPHRDGHDEGGSMKHAVHNAAVSASHAVVETRALLHAIEAGEKS